MSKTLEQVSSGRENSITFLRLIAALAVIYGHAHAVTKNPQSVELVSMVTGYAHAGGVAVDFFFILSGYLVTASLLKSGPKHYISSRLLRIFPALWMHLFLVTFVMGAILTTLPLIDYLANVQTWKYFGKLATATGTEWFLPGVFESNRDKAVNGSIWSVIIEIRLYAALLLLYFLGLFRSRALFNVLALGVVALTAVDVIEIPGLAKSSTDAHVVMFFVFGSFLWVNRALVASSPFYLLAALLIAGMALGTPKFAYGYALLLLAFFITAPFSPAFSWLNEHDYSYGIYLYGWPVQQCVAMAWPEQGAIFNAAVSMVLSTAIAAVSWHYLEKPALSLKRYVAWPQWRKKLG